MNWNKSIRQVHRGLAIVFTVAVIFNFIFMGNEEIGLIVGILTLIPLGLLWCSGMYLFVLPHATRWRRGRSAA